MPTATLTLTDEKGRVLASWSLTGKRNFHIGRQEDNDIPLSFTWVSRKHAMIQIEANGRCNAIDLGSSNGTFVNGRRITTPTPLRSGDLIQVGNKATVLAFLDNQPPQEETAGLEAGEERTVAFLEKVTVTVLVCDIRNFTHLSETIGDQPISSLLKQWSAVVSDIVNAHQGHVDKFIGDAVMATWSGGASQLQDIISAIRVAALISEATERLGASTPGLPWPLKIGCAMNTGEAVLGNLGVDGRRDFTVVGDTVNVAFRLEDLNKKVGTDFLMGAEAAFRLNPTALGRHFQPYRYQVKGKKDPVTAYGCDFAQLQNFLADNG